MTTCEIQHRRCGSLHIRVRWDPEDRVYHCRVLLNSQKLAEMHVPPAPGAGVCSSKAHDVAARKAVERVLAERPVLFARQYAELSGSVPKIAHTDKPKAGRYRQVRFG